MRFFEPASLRTTAYHELTVGYLSFAAQRGLTRAHIWACPPARSVTYIFWRRPPDQRTPSRDHLRSWYKKMLALGAATGVVKRVRSLYDTHWELAQLLGDGGGHGGHGTGHGPVTGGRKMGKAAAAAKASAERVAAAAAAAAQAERAASGGSDPQHYGGLPPYFEGDFFPIEAEQLFHRRAASEAAAAAAAEAIAPAAVKRQRLYDRTMMAELEVLWRQAGGHTPGHTPPDSPRSSGSTAAMAPPLPATQSD